MPQNLEAYRREITEGTINELLIIHPRTICLKNGDVLDGVVPTHILRDDGGRPQLFYKSGNEVLSVSFEQIMGIDVVAGEGDYIGTFLIQFNYFQRNFEGLDRYEEDKRVIDPRGIYFGLHLAHADLGELPDFYLVGDDTQYEADPERHFPLWRILGPYGSPVDSQQQFLLHLVTIDLR